MTPLPVFLLEERVYCLEAVGVGVRLILVSRLVDHYQGGIDYFSVDADDAMRTAERVGRTGWIPNADDLDLETLLSLDEGLRSRAVLAELGPILGDARMGSALLETLGVYFAVGHNAREAARRLHLAPRTVAYRLQRVEDLLGHPLDSGATLRLSVALFAYQLERETPGVPVA